MKSFKYKKRNINFLQKLTHYMKNELTQEMKLKKYLSKKNFYNPK